MSEKTIKSHLNLRIKKRASQRFSTGLYLLNFTEIIFIASETLIKFTEGAPKKVSLNEEEAAIIIQRQWRVRCEKRRYLKEINEEFFVSESLRVEKMEKQLESIKFDMEMEAYMLELEDLGTVFRLVFVFVILSFKNLTLKITEQTAFPLVYYFFI